MRAVGRQDYAVAAAPERLAMMAARLVRTVAVARALVKSGRAVELAGLQDGIGILCAQTLDLPAEEGRAMLPALRELVAQLEALTEAFRAPRR
jgi:hypothetical protein